MISGAKKGGIEPTTSRSSWFGRTSWPWRGYCYEEGSSPLDTIKGTAFCFLRQRTSMTSPATTAAIAGGEDHQRGPRHHSGFHSRGVGALRHAEAGLGPELLLGRAWRRGEIGRGEGDAIGSSERRRRNGGDSVSHHGAEKGRARRWLVQPDDAKLLHYLKKKVLAILEQTN